jgi:hypothetical protein
LLQACLLIRGYYPSYSFSSAGYYALPFTSAESIQISAGSYYHLVYLLTPGDKAAQSGWRIGNDPSPPGVGGEFWNGQYWPSSAGWPMGLVRLPNRRRSSANPGAVHHHRRLSVPTNRVDATSKRLAAMRREIPSAPSIHDALLSLFARMPSTRC